MHRPGLDSSGRPVPSEAGDYYCDANKVGGVYCPEFDTQEANSRAWHTTPHTCDSPVNGHYNSCDGGGRGLSTQQSGKFGPGAPVDTNQPFNVSTSFVESGGWVTTRRLDCVFVAGLCGSVFVCICVCLQDVFVVAAHLLWFHVATACRTDN